MISKPIAFALLVAACVVAAAGGAYVAVRQNGSAPQAAATAVDPSRSQPAIGQTASGPTTAGAPAASPNQTAPPVAEPAAAKAPVSRPSTRVTETKPMAAAVNAGRTPEPAANAVPDPAPEPTAPPASPLPQPGLDTPPPLPSSVSAVEPAPPPKELVHLVVPAESALGLQLETTVSSDRARIEDRVEARVSRDVRVDGVVAIPAGSQVIGAVTLVERGGRVKNRARLGLRFHTLRLVDGTEFGIGTDTIYREGASPANRSGAKIGGAALGGAILGAILGGGKGAAIGSGIGAAGGTAAVMAGDRPEVIIPAGTIVTARLIESLAVTIER